jgi:hypothetical protein
MTLQTSVTAKTASDASKITSDISATALCTAIDNKITTASSNGLYAVSLKLIGNHVDGVVYVDMDSAGQQNLTDLMETLKENGFRASEFINSEKKTDFRVDLKIAWDNV